MKKLYFLFLLSFIFTLNLSAQCELTSFTVELNLEMCDGELGGVSFEFEGENFGLNGFTVSGQEFELGDVYNLVLSSDCLEEYEITITDNDDPDCTMTVIAEPICCPCELGYDLEVESSDCLEGDVFDITLDFDPEVGSCLWYEWDLTMNDIPISYVYSGTDFIYDASALSSEDSTLIFTFCNQGNSSECFSDTITNPCFDSTPCSLESFTVELNLEMCDGELGGVSFEFEGENFGLNGFTVTDGETVQNFELGDDYNFGLLSDCSVEYEITITDNDDPDCTMTVIAEPICCPCELGFDLEVESSDCLVGNVFDITLDFYPEVGSCLWYEWDLTMNDIPISFIYSGTDFIYDASALSSEDSTLIFTFCSQGNSSECFSDTITNPCYNAPEISNVTAEIECEDGLFDVTIDFDFENESDEGFSIVGNGINYGDFNYDDLPIVLEGLEADCDLEYEFIITDLGGTEASDFIEVGEVCCPPCTMTTLDFGANPSCDGNLIITTWLIDGENTSEVGYDVYINDEFELFLTYDSDAWYDFNIIAPDTETFVIKVCDNDNPDCCIDWELENPCYVSATCEISDVTAEVNCEDGFFDVTLDFNYSNEGNEGFSVMVNGVFYEEYEYDQVPVTLEGLEADCNIDYEFTIINNDDESCMSSLVVGEICCPGACNMTSLDFDGQLECDGGLIVGTWLIEGENTSEVAYDVYINGVFELTVTYESDNWYDFNITAPDTETFVIKVCDIDNADCCIEHDFLNPCYNAPMISNVTAEIECEDGFFDVTIDFDFENESDEGFSITGNGINYGDFSYDDLPIVLEGLEADCDLEYEFIITDLGGTEASDFIEVGEVCCPPCSMTTLDFGANPSCDGGLIITTWLIDGENTSEVGYDVYINDEFELFLTYDSDAWYDFDITAPDTETFVIKVCDNDNADCCIDWELENPCYEATTCEISDITAEVNCEDGFFDVTLDFNYSNEGTEGFSVMVNGVFYEEYEYDQVPFTLEGLEADCNIDYEFTIINNDDESCMSSLVVGEICCPGTCNMTTLDFDGQLECEGDLIVGTWLIEGENTSEVAYDVYINEVFELTIDYDSGNWYDFDITAPDTETFVIKVCDNDNADCCIDWELENPCYEEPIGDCAISDLIVEVSACEEELFDVTIDFNYMDVGSSGFSVVGNGVDYGDFEYNQLPITITGLEADCELDYEFVITDNEDADCTSSLVLGIVCCSDECELTNLSLVAGDCEDGSYILTIDFDYENPGNDNFDLWILDDFIGVFELTSLPLTIEVANTTDETNNVTICINENDDCCIDGEIENPCYEEPQGICAITDFSISLEIEDGKIVSEIELETTGECSMEFEVSINGENLGSYTLAESTINIMPFTSTEDSITIKVCSSEDDNVCASITMLNPLLTGVEDVLDSMIDIKTMDSESIIVTKTISEELNISIITLDGKRIHKSSMNANQTEIQILTNNWIKGLYFIQIQTKDQQLTKKLFL